MNQTTSTAQNHPKQSQSMTIVFVRATIMFIALVGLPTTALVTTPAWKFVKSFISRNSDNPAVAQADNDTGASAPPFNPMAADMQYSNEMLTDSSASNPLGSVTSAGTADLYQSQPSSEFPDAISGDGMPSTEPLSAAASGMIADNHSRFDRQVPAPGAIAQPSDTGQQTDALTIAPQAANPAPRNEDEFTKIERRLRELGATFYRLEAWGSSPTQYQFTCRVALDEQHLNYERPFEAIDNTPLGSMQKVLSQVEAWRKPITQNTRQQPQDVFQP